MYTPCWLMAMSIKLTKDTRRHIASIITIIYFLRYTLVFLGARLRRGNEVSSSRFNITTSIL